jgi:predicted unusual protein kinase regulating ubiquinone biosynthesis (AarF/ABC1/UbiB family)
MGWNQTYRFPWMRQQEISLVLTQLLRENWFDQRSRFEAAYQHQRRARWLVNRLVDLGPTFIKLGQFLTSRTDLLPLEYIHALKALPGWMPPISIDAVFSSIEAEFGASAFLLYRTFDPLPIMADSLGQVHRATLPNGTAVVVKVQRPEVEQLCQLDLAILRKLMPTVQRHFGKNSLCNLEHLFEEFAQRVTQEINWIQTAVNADRLRHNFRDTPAVWIPKIYPRYTTKRILTMEYAPGISFTDRLRLEANGFELSAIQQLTVYCYLKQVLQDGFFQTNLDPSRFAISQDSRLILYGFSNMAELSSLKRSQMIQALFDLRRQDSSAAIHSLVNGGILKHDIDRLCLKQIMQTILQYLGQDSVDRQSFNQLQAEVYQVFRQQPFCLPSHTLWILQGLASLDKMAQAVDPTYSLLQSSQPLLANPSVYQRLAHGIDGLGSLLLRQRSE